jgi:hypothetical protein
MQADPQGRENPQGGPKGAPAVPAKRSRLLQALRAQLVCHELPAAAPAPRPSAADPPGAERSGRQQQEAARPQEELEPEPDPVPAQRACPLCGVLVRAAELQQHVQQELEAMGPDALGDADCADQQQQQQQQQGARPLAPPRQRGSQRGGGPPRKRQRRRPEPRSAPLLVLGGAPRRHVDGALLRELQAQKKARAAAEASAPAAYNHYADGAGLLVRPVRGGGGGALLGLWGGGALRWGLLTGEARRGGRACGPHGALGRAETKKPVRPLMPTLGLQGGEDIGLDDGGAMALQWEGVGTSTF